MKKLVIQDDINQTKLINSDKINMNTLTDNQLETYSPKYYKILEHLLDETLDGLHLLYSNFRTLEGIGIFKIILDYYGFTEFKIEKIKKGSNDIFQLNIKEQNPYYKDSLLKIENGRKYYALYTGKEDTEIKEIIRNIYNGELSKIPPELRQEVAETFFNNDLTQMNNEKNKNGNIIKLLMISSSGAEGIDLKNVRYVHIMEPYWHPVRMSQVIGRARRICSHSELPEEKQNVRVYMYLLVYDPIIIKVKKKNLENFFFMIQIEMQTYQLLQMKNYIKLCIIKN